MKKRSGKFWLSKNTAITLALALVALVLLSVYAWSQSHPSKTTTVTPQPSASLPMGGHGPTPSVAAGPSHDTTPSATPTTISNPSHPVSSTLAAPQGPYDNTSQISLSNCDGSTYCMDSTCTSSLGASCYVQATGNGKTVAVGDAKTITSVTAQSICPGTPRES